MIKKILFFIPLITFLFCGCKKQETPNTAFTLTATLRGSNSVLLNWPANNLTGFKNVTIYRSTEPIPDPTFDKQIDGNLEIGVINDNTIINFIDSNISVGNSGSVYYKVVLNLNNRFITSNQTQTTLNAFAVTLPNNNGQFSSSFTVKRIPEMNLLYTFDFNQGIMTAVNYTQKKIIATGSFSNFNSNFIYACINNNNPEIFVYSNNSIICYNGLTLTQKYSINITWTIYDFKVKNGFLYALTSSNSSGIAVYNLSTQSLVNQTSFPYPSNISSNSLFISSQSNTLFLKYSSQNYNNQTSTYYYTNKLIAYNIANGIPSGVTSLNIAALNGDSTNSNNTINTNYVQVSPDGKYVACNQNGDIYTISDNSMHSIRSANNFNPVVSFSNDGTYTLGKPVFSSTSSQPFGLMDIYASQGFSLKTSLNSQNPNTGFFFDDFMDNDTLLSYNIGQTFTSNQTENTLTVLFKKVD